MLKIIYQIYLITNYFDFKLKIRLQVKTLLKEEQIHKLLPCLNVHLIRNRHEEFIELDTLYFSGFRGRRKG